MTEQPKWWHVRDPQGFKQETILMIRIGALLLMIGCFIALPFLFLQLKENIHEAHSYQDTTFVYSGHRFRVEYEKREGQIPLARITHDTACKQKEVQPAGDLKLPPHR